MIVISIIAVLIIGAALSLFTENYKQGSAKWISLISVSLSVFLLFIWHINQTSNFDELTILFDISWITVFHINITLAIDNLSLLLLYLTLFLGLVSIAISWQEINTRVSFYYFNLLFVIAGVVGAFTAIDMFLFFVFWEVMLLPITALIAIWGHENKSYAAIKFFIFTQVSSLLMLIAIVLMAKFSAEQLGQLSFNYLIWQKLNLPENIAFYLMLGFFIAFAVKLPSVPLHSWLPDAHTQAPTAGSVLLAGILLKTGAYGLIRFVIQLFPSASVDFAPVAAFLAVLSILYGAAMAFAQSDFKRLIAYSSISHMGFVMLALFSFNLNAFNGAIVTIVAHGIASAALFSIAGMLFYRLHSRELSRMGGLWQSSPILGGFTLVFISAAIGLPGLANFIGEVMTLLGSYSRFPVHTMLATLSIIGSAIYGIVLFQRSFHGATSIEIFDINKREVVILGLLLGSLLAIGLKPSMLLAFDYTRGIL